MKFKENILILKKKTKFDYLIEKYSIQVVKNSVEYQQLKNSHIIQEENCNKFIKLMYKKIQNNQSIDIITDSFLNNEELSNKINSKFYNKVFTLGGDGTFLRSIGLLAKNKNKDPLFIGINTDMKRSHGYYCSLNLNDNTLDTSLEKILKNKCEISKFNKIRVDFMYNKDDLLNTNTATNNNTITTTDKVKLLKNSFYFVNDIYFGENFKGRVSKYNLLIDKEYINKYIINNNNEFIKTCNDNELKELYSNLLLYDEDRNLVNREKNIKDILFNNNTKRYYCENEFKSSDNGYSGWIKHSNNISLNKYENVYKSILSKIDKDKSVDKYYNNNFINNYIDNCFSLNSSVYSNSQESKNKIFYYVSEPSIFKPKYNITDCEAYFKFKLLEGVVESIIVKSYCYDGVLIVDGSLTINIDYNEEFKLTVGDEKVSTIQKI